MSDLIQLADDQSTPTGIVRLVGNGEDDLIPLFTYLIGDSPPNRFFLQIAASNRNLSRFSPDPFGTIALAQMLALLGDKGYDKDAIVANVTYYEASVEALIEDGDPKTPYVRPTTGAVHRLAATAEIIDALELPESKVTQTRIGKLARSGEAEVPIHANRHVLDHHALVAGATGSGKSHLLSNLAHAAAALGRCVILFDHKPDHQDHHEPNPDADEPFRQAFNLDDDTHSGVRYWTLDEDDPNRHATVVGARASDIDPAILAGTIFHHGGEELQAEVFEHTVTVFADQQAERRPNQQWTIHDIVQFLRDTNDGQLSQLLYGANGTPVSKSTMGAIRRKIALPGRTPKFLDRQLKPDPLGHRRATDDIAAMFKPGLNVLRINESNARGYALFLDQLLKRAASLRARSLRDRSSEQAAPELEIIVDEASDIFQAESKRLRDAASSMLAEQIRKGRSLHIGYVISVQSAGDVPDRIRNNLNTTIIGRHRNMSVLREALPTAKPEMLEQADKLMPGEMYLDLFGVRSLLLCNMDLSPSKLTVAE